MVIKQLMRYAHSDGHVDVCFNDTGEYLLTGGSDGDVRIYKGFDDEDPVSYRAGDIIYAVAFKGNRFYVAADDNAVQSYTLEGGEPDGLIVRFTAHATHIVISRTGTKLIAGASDFMIKVVDLETKSHQTVSGHTAPILSVALHPNERFLASASCDGTVRITRLDDLKEVKVITGLPKSNDLVTSTTLCRLSFDKLGKFLFVPFEKSIKVFESKNWAQAFELTDDSIKQALSIVSLSACGKYLAAATRDGKMIIWDTAERHIVLRETHEKGRSITGLAWNPRSYDLVYSDSLGYMGLLKDAITGSLPPNPPVAVGDPSSSAAVQQDELDFDEVSDLFDDVDDGTIPGVDTDIFDDDEDNVSSVTKTVQKAPAIPAADDDNADAESLKSAKDLVTALPSSSVPKGGWQPVPLQQPFQPASCPVSVSTRFMVWNNVGIVTQYNTEEEESIDVEFHDTATHHAIHVNNTLGHTMADLSTEAVLLASEADDDGPSQLVCMHFASWDNCNEWSTAMPKGEDILIVCLGGGWLAVATDQRLVRIFTVGGVQRQVFRLPGPVVTMAAHTDFLLVVYHSGLGIAGDQCLSYQLLNLSCKKTVCSDRLPLGPKSTLYWIGFSGEGSVFAVDSNGSIQMLNRGFCNAWTTVANLRDHCKGKSDNYWVVGIQENSQQLRAILCKGSKYPPILPKPTMQLIPFQIPLCELTTDKGTLEEQFWRTSLFGEYLNCWLADGYDVDESEKQRLLLAEQELLMKQFALACKMKREYRAVEICQMMSSCRAVQLAIKYSTQLGLMQVAERLNEVARQRAEAEQTIVSGMELPVSWAHNHIARRGELGQRERVSSVVQNRYSDDEGDDTVEVDDDASSDKGVEDVLETNGVNNSIAGKHLLPLRCKSEKCEKDKFISLSISQASKSNKNPFKVSKPSETNRPVTVSNQIKGTSVFDSMEKTKQGRFSLSSSSKQTKDLLFTNQATASSKKGSSSQVKLFEMAKVKNTATDASKEEKNSTRTPMTGFQMWFQANRSSLSLEFSDINEVDLTIKAAKKYKQLTKDEQQDWQTKADVLTEKTVERKRKQTDTEAEYDGCDAEIENSVEGDAPQPKKMKDLKSEKNENKQKLTNKLSGFMFNKN